MPDYHELKRLAKRQCEGNAIRVAIIGDCSTQHLTTAVKGTAFFEGLNLDLFDADYDQVEAQLTDPTSEVYQFSPSFILLVMCTEKLQEAFYASSPDSRASFAEDTLARITRYWSSISHNHQCALLQFNFVYCNDGIMGSYAIKEPSSFPYQLQKLNYLLSEAASHEKNVFFVDVNGIQSTVGRDRYYDEKIYYLSKMPFSLEVLPAIAKMTVDVILALQGRFKKAVILDLDNTLWGGVIGDDGLEGIQIGELGAGHAFSTFQVWLKELKNRGILLAVCSKNEEAAAKLPFLKHPEMVLRLDDITTFVANWDTKDNNIRRIQETLNIGMDSIVFIDDNPFERAHIRSMFPEISVPELPEDPARYLSSLLALNLFETAQFSYADRERTEQYRVEAKRAALMSTMQSYQTYLQSLNMRAVAKPFEVFYYQRIAQLSQRSNQFNLRTIRYTEAEVEAVASNPAQISRYYMLSDQFGEYGLISVVILDKQAQDTLFISEWFMSCRVLKRGMEEFIVNDILHIARGNGCQYVLGEYIPTQKNKMVADLYARMGFQLRADGLFSMDVHHFQALATSIIKEE